MKTVLRHLRKAALLQAGDRLTDAQLLGAFVARRDEAAFEALVRRHGPMVLGVARRVVGNAADCEDVFQATFLVLVKKAAAVRPREALGNWLYGVTYRTALKVKGAAARRRAKERQVRAMARPDAAEEEGGEELLHLLDKELSRLPDKYRLAVVLCDLEGRPRKQVARQFAIPEGTLSSRLTTARRLLAKRLARLGLAVSGGALATALAARASAAVPPALVVSTVRVGVRVAAGQAVAVTVPVSLSKEVVKTMLVAKLKLAVGAVMVAAALGAGGVAYQVSGPRTAQAAPEAKPPGELEALKKENELLKFNLQVVLEKARALESDVRALKEQVKTAKAPNNTVFNPAPYTVDALTFPSQDLVNFSVTYDTFSSAHQGAVQQAEAALKALREAKGPEARRRAADALEQAVKKLKEQPTKPGKPQGGK
jgi:RNA polymerase sigma factor (sigma-70 family)